VKALNEDPGLQPERVRSGNCPPKNFHKPVFVRCNNKLHHFAPRKYQLVAALRRPETIYVFLTGLYFYVSRKQHLMYSITFGLILSDNIKQCGTVSHFRWQFISLCHFLFQHLLLYQWMEIFFLSLCFFLINKYNKGKKCVQNIIVKISRIVLRVEVSYALLIVF